MPDAPTRRPRHGRLLSIALVAALAMLGAILPASAHPERPGEGLLGDGSGASGGSHTEHPHHYLREVGFNPIDNEGFNTDIMPWTTRDGGVYVSTGTWGSALANPLEDCPSETDNPAAPQHSGVKILRATDPRNPVEVARLGTPNGSQNNDIKVDRLPTTLGDAATADQEDILVHSLEPCGVEGVLHQIPGTPFVDFLAPILSAVGLSGTGFHVYDVRDPENPVLLGKWNNGGIGTHNLWLFEQGGGTPDRADDRAFVAAVWNRVDFFGVQDEETVTGELQIVEITNPSTPVLVGRWALEDSGLDCPARGAHSENCFLHDVTVSANGRIAYLSFWDAGLILLDVSDPSQPRFIGQALEHVQPNDPTVRNAKGEITKPGGWLNEEGNTHAAVPMKVDGRHLVIVGDEDFVGGGLPGFQVNSPDALAGFHDGVTWAGAPEPDGETANLVYAGTGCTPLQYGPVAAEIQGNIALVDDRQAANNPLDRCPTYTYFQKVRSAQEAGAIGFIQIPRAGDEPNGNATAIQADIPALEVFRTDEVLEVRKAVIAGTEVNVTLEAHGPNVNPWGFMRVVDVSNLRTPRDWTEVSTFKAPHVMDPAPGAQDVFSAHNPVIGPDNRIYFSWYTDGARVLELANGGRTVKERAWFVPLPSDHPNDNDSDPHGVQEDNVGFWGTWPLCHPTTGQLLVFNSDLNRGVYVLRAEYSQPCATRAARAK